MSVLFRTILNSKCSQCKFYFQLRPEVGLRQQHLNSVKTWNCHEKKHFSQSSGSNFQSDFALGRLLRPLGFALVFSGATLAGSAFWHHKSHQTISEEIKKYRRSRRRQKDSWYNLSDANKIFVPILAVNSLVWLAWRVPRWQPTMVKYFITSLSLKNNLCWPMILSVFSHIEFLHLAANMYVLHSFSEAAVSSLGKEQFLAMYLSSGVFSSLASYLNMALIRRPGGALGASGAVTCVMAYVCMRYPDSQMSFIFFPFYTFAASTALKGLLVFETVACALKWAIFDHAAHLGGALFGIFWFQWGQKYVWRKVQALFSSLRKNK